MRVDPIKLLVEMKKQDIKQKDLAKACGYSRTSINGICNGKSCMERTARAIARTLNVPLEKLI